jgi:hypothetical protein
MTKASAHLCKIYTFIMQRTLIDFPWIVTEDYTNVGGRLLVSMITTLKHKCIDVSDLALEFFYNFYGQINKLK